MTHESERGTDEYDGSEHHGRYILSDEDVDRIARRVIVLAGEELAKAAGKQAMQEVYVSVGKGVLARIGWLLGVIGIIAIAWATKNHIDIR